MKGKTVGQTKMGLYKQTKRKQASEDWIGEQTKFEQGKTQDHEGGCKKRYA